MCFRIETFVKYIFSDVIFYGLVRICENLHTPKYWKLPSLRNSLSLKPLFESSPPVLVYISIYEPEPYK